MAEKSGLKRLLMTTDTVGGVWRYSLDLIGALTVAHEVEILLATLGPLPSKKQEAEVRALPRTQLAGGGFALEWMQDPWTDVGRSREWLSGLEKQFAPDVIHLNGYALAAGSWRTPVISVAHSCVYSWWRGVHHCAPGADWEEYKGRVAEGLDAAAAVVAPSRFMAQCLAFEYGLPPGKVEIIHNFSGTGARVATKKPYLLAAGRMWDEAKNLALLDSIAGTLDWPVHLAGSRQLDQSTPAYGQSTHWFGNLPHAELLAHMAEASIFVHPALYEPFGLAVLEAAQAGCCLVLSDIPSLRELWSGAAVFVDPMDREAWKEAINKLISNPAERTRLAERATLRAGRYRADLSLTKYLDVYESAIRRKTAGSGVAA